MQKIRTRYAPSPTGYLHIGGARTALFAYLYAKNKNGDFIIRIEDTDIERNVENGESSQIDNLRWLGIEADESPLKPNPDYAPYRQSEKFDRYYEIALKLIQEGLAYKAYDSDEELEKQKQEAEAKGLASFRYDRNWLKISDEEKQKRDLKHEFVIRLVSKPNIIYRWNDKVRGEISFDSNDIGDWVIIKSNKIATYNFAVVIDDHDMAITDVLRGEEHITNTPKQLMVYDALGWKHPNFGHLTIITNEDGKKLSKRDTSLKQFIEDYKIEGYHPEGIFNFLALLGWTHPDAKEVMNHETLIKDFNPARLSKSPSKFDIEKMNWFSKQYWQKEDDELIIEKLRHLKNDDNWLEIFVKIHKPHMVTVKQIEDELREYLEPKIVDQKFNDDEIKVIKTFAKFLSETEFTNENIKSAIDLTSKLLNVKGKPLFMSIRRAFTFKEHGPELANSIYLYGETFIKNVIKKWL
ncbi:glutamate--tRNA ligase [Mycoplasmopsis agassizii]|uniref:glutamate--tRNA ligase n=1 Tax=Mycoplasmopsis agassizii TaxID=33922 RepID=UPI0035295C01